MYYIYIVIPKVEAPVIMQNMLHFTHHSLNDQLAAAVPPIPTMNTECQAGSDCASFLLLVFGITWLGIESRTNQSQGRSSARPQSWSS